MLTIIAKEGDLENNHYLVENLIDRKAKKIRFERPNGRTGYAKDVYIAKNGFINDFSMEYGAFEFTRNCNVRCAHCYVAAEKINGHEPEYINLDFIIDLSKELEDTRIDGKRQICITGGEPTLDINKLQTRYGLLDESIKHKSIYIATNLLILPYTEEGIGDFFSRFPGAVIQASYSPYLEKQYEIRANALKEGDTTLEGKIPSSVMSEFALLEKIRLFDDYAHKHKKKFILRVNAATSKEMEEFMKKAKSYIGSKGRDDDEFIYSARVVRVGNGRKLKKAANADEAARECSNMEEIYMCFNGDLYPTVNHIDNPKNRIGTLVRIE